MMIDVEQNGRRDPFPAFITSRCLPGAPTVFGARDKNTLPAFKVHFFKDRFHRGADRIFGHVRVASFNIFDDILEFCAATARSAVEEAIASGK